MQESLQVFLEDELSDQEFYDGIIEFIYSYNIRSGEYEGNRFVIKKMDLLNFIIFEEYVIDGKREIGNTIPISRKKLIKRINLYAKKQGFLLRSFSN